MKFTVDATDFKKAVDRALSINYKGMAIPVLKMIKISTHQENGDYITVSATNAEEWVEIELDAEIHEEGYCYVHRDDIVKAYNMKGSIVISTKDRKFQVKNSKKTSEILTKDFDEDAFPNKPTLDEVKPLFEIAEDKLLFGLGKLSPFKSKDATRPIFQGFNVNVKDKVFEVTDGYRAVRWEPGITFSQETSVILNPNVYTSLKKIGNAKSNKSISAYVSDGNKYTVFKGGDYVYTSRNLDGNYFDLSNFFSGISAFDFTVDAKELGAVAKEYSKLCKKSPMYLMRGQTEALFVGTFLSDYESVEQIETAEDVFNIPELYAIALDPKYIMEATGLFEGKIRVKSPSEKVGEQGTSNNAITLEGISETEFKTFILPMRGKPEHIVNKMREIIKNM